MSAKTASARTRESEASSGPPRPARACDRVAWSPTPIEQLAGNFAMQRLVQARLRVGAIDDPQEREAEEAASCGGCNDITPCAACSEKKVRRSERDASSNALTLSEGRMARLGSGVPLDAMLRVRMQRRLGHDFSRVRVHTGPLAAETARSIQARAFTTGSDVVFDEGELRPGTPEGDRLLAHELAHVAQNGGETTTVRRVVNGDIRRISITQEFARALTDEELPQQMQILRDEMAANPPSSAAYQSAEQNMAVLDAETRRRNPDAPMPGQLVERPAGLPLDGGYRLTPIDVPSEVAAQIPEGRLVTVSGEERGVGSDARTAVTGGASGSWAGLRTNLSTYGFAAVGDDAIGLVAFPRYAPGRALAGLSAVLPEHPIFLWGHTAVYVRQGGRIVSVRSYAPASLGELALNPTLRAAVRGGTAEVPAALYAEQGIFDIFNVSNARSVEWPVTPQQAAAMAEGMPEGSLYGFGRPMASGAQYTAVPGVSQACTGTNCIGWATAQVGEHGRGFPLGQGPMIREMTSVASQEGVVAAGGLSRGMQVLKWGGRVMLVVGIALVPVEVAMAPPGQRTRTAVGATAGLLGGVATGAAAGLVCGPGAPFCSVVLGLGFGIAGALGARSIAESVYDWMTEEQHESSTCPGNACHAMLREQALGYPRFGQFPASADLLAPRLQPPRTQQLSADDMAMIRRWIDTQPRTSASAAH